MIEAFLVWLCQYLPRYHIPREPGVPYMTRYYLLGRDGEQSAWGFLARSPLNVFLHNIQASDGPEFHNHPWKWSASLILVAGYYEERVLGWMGVRWSGAKLRHRLKPGQVNFIHSDVFHRIDVDRPAWTLFCAGSKVQKWVFLRPNKKRARMGSGRAQCSQV